MKRICLTIMACFSFLPSGCLTFEAERWAKKELNRIQNEWPIMKVTHPSIEQIDYWYLTSYYTYWRFLHRVLSGETQLRPSNTSITYGYCVEKNFYVLYFTWITALPNYGIGIFLQEEASDALTYIALEPQALVFNSRNETWGMEGYSVNLLEYFPLKTLTKWIEKHSLPKMKVLLNNGMLLENDDYVVFFRDVMDPKLGMDVQTIKEAEPKDQADVEKALKMNQEKARKLHNFVLWWTK